MGDTSNDQSLVLKVESKIHQFKKTVFDRRIIRKLTQSDRSIRARLGYGKDGKPIVRRIGSDQVFAAKFKELWNKSITENDHFLAESLNDLTSLAIRRAVVKLKDFPSITLEMCVDYYIQNALPFRGKVTVREAVDIYLEIQKEKNLKETSYSKKHSNYRTYFKPFADFFGDTDLALISPDQMEGYFKTKGNSWNSKSWNEHRSRLSGLWNILAENQYCSISTNPLNIIIKKRQQRKRNSEKVCNPDIVRCFFHWMEKECVKYPSKTPELALSTLTWFCGIRIKEVSRIDWDGIDQNTQHLGKTERDDYSGWSITVWGDQEKTSTDKINPIPLNAQLWLNLCFKLNNQKNGPIASKDHEQRMKRLRSKFCEQTKQSPFPQNSARHGWASNHLALYGNKILTAERLGHGENPTTLEKSYKTGLNPHGAKNYFSIIPKSEETKLRKTYFKHIKEKFEEMNELGPFGTEEEWLKDLKNFENKMLVMEKGDLDLDMCNVLLTDSGANNIS